MSFTFFFLPASLLLLIFFSFPCLFSLLYPLCFSLNLFLSTFHGYFSLYIIFITYNLPFRLFFPVSIYSWPFFYTLSLGELCISFPGVAIQSVLWVTINVDRSFSSFLHVKRPSRLVLCFPLYDRVFLQCFQSRLIGVTSPSASHNFFESLFLFIYSFNFFFVAAVVSCCFFIFVCNFKSVSWSAYQSPPSSSQIEVLQQLLRHSSN